jgi:hypothetical protein
MKDHQSEQNQYDRTGDSEFSPDPVFLEQFADSDQ